MSCREIESKVADYLGGSLADSELREMESHLAGCDGCRREIDSLARIWEGLGELPDEQPAAALRVRFDAMLDGFIRVSPLPPRRAGAQADSAGSRSRWSFPERLLRSPAWQLGLTIAALLAGIVLGSRFLAADAAGGELEELRTEVASLSRLVSLSLLEQSGATDRLRGVSYGRRSSDPEVLAALIGVVETDPDVNVRLAALDALAAFADRPPVTDRLRAALSGQQSPLVQLALVELLLAVGGQESRDAVGRLLDAESLDPTVRGVVANHLRASFDTLNGNITIRRADS